MSTSENVESSGPEEFFSAHDINAIVSQAAHHAGARGLTRADAEQVLDEMVLIAWSSTMLELWRAGAVTIGWDAQQQTLRWYPDEPARSTWETLSATPVQEDAAGDVDSVSRLRRILTQHDPVPEQD